ncbi:MAG: hypothetical protein ABFS12_17895, partial [Bacteroidota bacterium]
NGNYTDYLEAGDLLNLPIGIKSDNSEDQSGNDGLNYMIGIANATFYATYAELEAYMIFEVPEDGKKIAFGAKNIRFNFKNGLLSGKLQLLTDFEISVSGNQSKLVLKGGYDDNAIARGDIIRAVSDSMDVNNVFKATDNIPSSVLSSPENLASYLKNLKDPNIIKDLSFYGREIRHLYQNNYLFDLTSKTFVR